MEPDSVGVLLPKILLPYLRQWAANSGFEVLSRLLVDEQLLSLVARYGDQLISQPKVDTGTGHVNGRARYNPSRNSRPPRYADDPGFQGGHRAEEPHSALAQLSERVSALEGLLSDQQAKLDAQKAELDTYKAMFQTAIERFQPLAQALGYCQECVVGLELCPRCFGRSAVGYFPPDLNSLRDVILDPLAAMGVYLRVCDEGAVRSRRPARNVSTKKKKGE